MHITPHITIGKKDVKLTSPSHVAGVEEGNSPHRAKKDGVRRSTGIAPKSHAPIDPSMPKLTPA
jgi:hypothetical protein